MNVLLHFVSDVGFLALVVIVGMIAIAIGSMMDDALDAFMGRHGFEVVPRNVFRYRVKSEADSDVTTSHG